MTLPEDFNWNSAFGLYTQGEQWLNQKVWDKAESYLKKSLEQDANFSPALVRLSSLYYREGRYQEMIPLLERALGLNTYDGEANYLYGLANRMLGNATEAKAAFAIATFQLQCALPLTNSWAKCMPATRTGPKPNNMQRRV